MKLDEDMPTPKFLDLKPNRLLLDPKFDGYKLSLDTLPIYTIPFTHGVDKVGPTDDQYSIQHAKLFGLHNCLQANDPCNPHISYVVDRNWTIHKVAFNAETNSFEPLKEVFNIPTRTSQTLGRYNVNIVFPSHNYAIIGDGFSAFFIVETGDRSSSDCLWKMVHEQKEIQEHSTHNLGQFVILDSKIYEQSQRVFLDILLLRLQSKTDTDISEFLEKYDDQFLAMSSKHPFVSKINWITFKQQDNSSKWSHDCSRTLIGPSSLEYACLEKMGTGALIASENHFAFYHISNEPLRYKKSAAKKAKKAADDEKSDYVWMQNDKEITILFKMPIGATKTDVKVDIKSASICVVYNGTLMLEGELLHSIKSDEAVWTITSVSVTDEETQEDGDVASGGGEDLSAIQTHYQSLEIILQKVSVETRWEGDSVVVGGSTGQQVLDPEFIADIQERLNHLCSDKWNDDPLRAKVCDPHQLEECDGMPADTTSFMRLDKDLQCISHVASLGGHQWLLTARVHGFSTPAMCVRHDVDGLVWQPPEVDGTGKVNLDSWKLEHIGTFSAMGYVQASKQQRKFSVCPPDLSYLAICDASKHVYIYRQPHKIGSDLRNRKTGQIISHISKQHIVSLDPPVDILGVHATNDFLFVLTAQNIHAIRVKDAVDDDE